MIWKVKYSTPDGVTYRTYVNREMYEVRSIAYNIARRNGWVVVLIASYYW